MATRHHNAGHYQTVTAPHLPDNPTFEAFVPNPLPPPEIDLRDDDHLVLDANIQAVIDLAQSSPDGGYAAARLAAAHEASASSSIENVDAPTYSILMAGLTRGTLPDDHRRGLNNLQAIEHLIDSPINTESLHQAHSLLFRNDAAYHGQPGQIRDTQIFIVTGTGRIIRTMTPQHLVEPMMEDFQNWFHSPEYEGASLFAKLALSHYQFEAVHPYPDGNGRIGRAITAAIAAQHAPNGVHLPFSHSILIDADRRDYYHGLSTLQETGDWQPYMAFMYSAILNDALRNHYVLTKLNELRERSERNLPDDVLVQTALECVLQNPIITVSRLADITGATRANASRALAELEKKRIIQRHPEHPNPIVWECAEVMNISSIRRPNTLEPPIRYAGIGGV